MAKQATDLTSHTIEQTIIKREGLVALFTRLHSTGSIRATPCIGENTGKKRKNTTLETSQLNRPRVTYERFPYCWFAYAGKPWPVTDCPIDVIKSVLHEAIVDDTALELLSNSASLDLVARWFLCCESTIQLFESKEEAMHSMQIDDIR